MATDVVGTKQGNIIGKNAISGGFSMSTGAATTVYCYIYISNYTADYGKLSAGNFMFGITSLGMSIVSDQFGVSSSLSYNPGNGLLTITINTNAGGLTGITSVYGQFAAIWE